MHCTHTIKRRGRSFLKFASADDAMNRLLSVGWKRDYINGKPCERMFFSKTCPGGALLTAEVVPLPPPPAQTLAELEA